MRFFKFLFKSAGVHVVILPDISTGYQEKMWTRSGGNKNPPCLSACGWFTSSF